MGMAGVRYKGEYSFAVMTAIVCTLVIYEKGIHI